ncbi:MAG TPA: glycosyltransferase family 2 protein [Pseudolysinimonas sp.]|nr:glycosyltransferase family 2 protein [Pseudolysinimonas sp.]
MSQIAYPPRTTAPRVSIVIPAKDEARNLEVVLPQLPPVHQVILVDGHSVDDSVATARRVMPGIEIIEQTRSGKGNALACGFAAVTGDVIVMFDADGSADPAEIPAFVDALLAGADYAKGTRFGAGGRSSDITPFRFLGNFAFNALANLLFRTHYTDLCYGYNAFWTSVVPVFGLPDSALGKRKDGHFYWGDGFEIETMLDCRVASAKLKVTEVPSIERRRIFGKSNLHAFHDGFRVLETILMERPHVHSLANATAVRPAPSIVGLAQLSARRSS